MELEQPEREGYDNSENNQRGLVDTNKLSLNQRPAFYRFLIIR